MTDPSNNQSNIDISNELHETHNTIIIRKRQYC